MSSVRTCNISLDGSCYVFTSMKWHADKRGVEIGTAYDPDFRGFMCGTEGPPSEIFTVCQDETEILDFTMTPKMVVLRMAIVPCATSMPLDVQFHFLLIANARKCLRIAKEHNVSLGDFLRSEMARIANSQNNLDPQNNADPQPRSVADASVADATEVKSCEEDAASANANDAIKVNSGEADAVANASGANASDITEADEARASDTSAKRQCRR
jgi:hypothetical protein